MFTQRSILSIEFALQLCLIELLMKLCSIKHHRTLICMFLGVYVMAQICLEVTNSLLEPILVYFLVTPTHKKVTSSKISFLIKCLSHAMFSSMNTFFPFMLMSFHHLCFALK